MEINHTSHIRTPSGGLSKLREFICAYTLYNHVQTSADIINHWSKQISDNIDHTHSRYYNIDKTAKSFRNIQNILLIVSLISQTPQRMHYKARRLLLTCKRPLSKKTVRKPCTGFRSLRRRNMRSFLEKKDASQQSRTCKNGRRHHEAKKIIAKSRDIFCNSLLFSMPNCVGMHSVV